MAHYLVTARPVKDLMPELRERLDSDEIRQMKPFGSALHYSLTRARMQDADWAVWEEEDYCIPPLNMERRAVLDTYFTDLSVERVDQGNGWERIDELPALWQEEPE